MYNDILMNGSKKFVVSMSHPSAPGRFAAVGVVFEVCFFFELIEGTACVFSYILTIISPHPSVARRWRT
jgi:hypothetical protein